jgi:nitrilase
MSALQVAAVQAAYVLMDRDATIDRVAGLTAEAVREGAQLVVFPEVFVPGTPIWIDTQPIWEGDEDWFGLLAANAVVIGSPATERLAAIAAQHRVWLVVGVDEREEHGSTITTRCCTSRPGCPGRAAPIVPTGSSGVWGHGRRVDARVVDTASAGSAGSPAGNYCRSVPPVLPGSRCAAPRWRWATAG